MPVLCLCYRYCAHRKLTPNLKPFAIRSVLPEGHGSLRKSKVVAMTLNAFMASVDETINLRHVPNHCMDKDGVRNLDENEKPVMTNKLFVKATSCGL